MSSWKMPFVVRRQAFLTRARLEEGKFVVQGGMSYRVLVLQQTQGMTVELARKLLELVKQGMCLVGDPPSYSFPSILTIR